MYCQNCGSQVAETVKFCTKCGTPVQNPQSIQYQPSQTSPQGPYSPVQQHFNQEAANTLPTPAIPQGTTAKSTKFTGCLFSSWVAFGCVLPVGILLCFTGIGAIIGIPLILAALIFPFTGFAAQKAPCPYCGQMVHVFAGVGVNCPACKQRIVIRGKQFLKVDDATGPFVPQSSPFAAGGNIQPISPQSALPVQNVQVHGNESVVAQIAAQIRKHPWIAAIIIIFLVVEIVTIILPDNNSSSKSAITDNKRTSQHAKTETISEEEVIALVQEHVIPNGKTVMEQIKSETRMNYGKGEWMAYRAGQSTECPRSDIEDAQPKYADWIVCYKTVFKWEDDDENGFLIVPTWRVKGDNVYPMNGFAADFGDEIPPLHGVSSYSKGTFSEYGQPPTKFECEVENAYSGIPPEFTDEEALRKIANLFKITPKQVQEIHKRVIHFDVKQDSEKVVCPK